MKKTDAEIINTYFIDFESLNKEEREYFEHKSKIDFRFNSEVKLAKKIIEDIDNEGIRRLVLKKIQNNKKNQRQKKMWYSIAASVTFLFSSLGIYNHFKVEKPINSDVSVKSPTNVLKDKIFIDYIESNNSNLGYAGKNQSTKVPLLIYISSHGFQIDYKNGLIPNNSNLISKNSYYVFDDSLRFYTNSSDLPNISLFKSENEKYSLNVNNVNIPITKTFKPVPINLNQK